ncbi:43540_t:CDS:2 [Gigaspora margarita]|uniref:43540_t:CDS:1 n=1 Tax=Gigaspora margarita TaxID=4874 RepID=A0ABM8W3T0_GIGMA|nr:43540_t:CDS:2 [Gigaspora margarita]
MDESWINNKIEEGKIIEYKYDEFKKSKEIGHGTYSTVYRAIISTENQEKMYALKFIKNNAYVDKVIENELENMLLEEHPNIIKFYGITKVIDSGTLSDYLQKNATKIEWELKIQFAIQLILIIFISLNLECWQSKQSDRPTINEVSIILEYINFDPFYQDIPLIDFNISEYIDTAFDGILDIPAKIETQVNEQDPRIIFINGLYSNFYEMFNKGHSVKKIISDYISKNGKSDDEVLSWLYLNKDESKYVCLRGLFYMWNIGTEKIKFNVFDLFINAASKEDVIAQYFTGRCYEVGWNTKKDIKKAIEWYNKAISSGCAAAERILGDYYFKEQEYSKAFKLLQSAADKDNIMAMYNLGLCYKKGRGTDVNMEKGFEYLKQAAEMNVPYSSHELAKCYEYGEGTQKDLNEASYWFKKADCYHDRERVTVKIKDNLVKPV